ncbi:MAG: nicotinate phosphoribosyltransferase, partial [Desulfobacterales bacterium]
TYGIGTNLTNDVGVEPLNMVIKLSRTRPWPERPFQYTIKLSDDPGKVTGDAEELENCLRILNVKES